MDLDARVLSVMRRQRAQVCESVSRPMGSDLFQRAGGMTAPI